MKCLTSDDGCSREQVSKYMIMVAQEKLLISISLLQVSLPSWLSCYCKVLLQPMCEQVFPSRNRYTTTTLFSVSRPDCEKPINSFPQTHSFNDFQYKIALAFLRGADTLTKLSEATDTKLGADAYLEHVHNVLGNVVSRIDGNSK